MSIDASRSRILAHRGVHSTNIAKNSIESFRVASTEGFGLETDIRDHYGEIVISHDPLTSENPLPFTELLKLEFQGPVALNIKSDGLVKLNVDNAARRAFKDYFYFDHSIPELAVYRNAGLPVAQRVSNVEELKFETIYDVWFDHLESFPSKFQINFEALLSSHRVHLVSPELHGREHLPFWNKILPVFTSSPGLTICTDFPHDFLAALEKRND